MMLHRFSLLIAVAVFVYLSVGPSLAPAGQLRSQSRALSMPLRQSTVSIPHVHLVQSGAVQVGSDAPTGQQQETADTARASFDEFTREWMQRLLATEEFQKTQRLTVTETEDVFVAEYTGYLPHRYTVVKSTSSEVTPFVGILTYYKKRMQCTGKTEEEAIQGPFQQAATSQVSEIFRFT